MERNNPSTSHEAFDKVTPSMLTKDYTKILEALKVLDIAIYEELATFIGWSDKNKVSRRLKEMEGMSLVYKPGTKALTKSNRNAFQYKVMHPDTVVPPIPERQPKVTAVDHANLLIQQGENTKKEIEKRVFATQPELF